MIQLKRRELETFGWIKFYFLLRVYGTKCWRSVGHLVLQLIHISVASTVYQDATDYRGDYLYKFAGMVC